MRQNNTGRGAIEEQRGSAENGRDPKGSAEKAGDRRKGIADRHYRYENSPGTSRVASQWYYPR
ncbi:MAG: hypothetical protein ACK559_31930, partial [bacterium]